MLPKINSPKNIIPKVLVPVTLGTNSSTNKILSNVVNSMSIFAKGVVVQDVPGTNYIEIIPQNANQLYFRYRTFVYDCDKNSILYINE